MPAMAWIGGASRCVADDTIGEEGDVYKLSAPFSKKKVVGTVYIEAGGSLADLTKLSQ
jgi:hypothetical protein